MFYLDRHHARGIEETMIQGMAGMLAEVCTKVKVDPASVKLITELGVGVGRDSRAILQVFPNATIQAISYQDERDADLKTNDRIRFFQGEFVEVLKSVRQVGPADVVVIKNAGPHHGFNESNIGLLATAVGEGILITEGDNGSLFGDWFYQKFSLVASTEDFYPEEYSLIINLNVWRVK